MRNESPFFFILSHNIIFKVASFLSSIFINHLISKNKLFVIGYEWEEKDKEEIWIFNSSGGKYQLKSFYVG